MLYTFALFSYDYRQYFSIYFSCKYLFYKWSGCKKSQLYVVLLLWTQRTVDFQDVKQKLFQMKKFHTKYIINFEQFTNIFDQMLSTAKIICPNQSELYYYAYTQSMQFVTLINIVIFIRFAFCYTFFCPHIRVIYNSVACGWKKSSDDCIQKSNIYGNLLTCWKLVCLLREMHTTTTKKTAIFCSQFAL